MFVKEDGTISERSGLCIIFMVVLCTLIWAVSAEADCGCGGLPDSGPPSGWDDPGFDVSGYSSGSSTGGSSSGGGSGGGSGSGAAGGLNDNSATPSDSSVSGSTTGSSSGSSTGSQSDEAVKLTSEGIALFRQGDFNKSLIALNGSLERDPFSTKAWMAKGDVLAALGRFEEAVLAYDRVIRLDAGDPVAYAKRGDALLNAGKYKDAITAYDRALAMNPGLNGVRVNRSKAAEMASGLIVVNVTTTSPTLLPTKAESTGLALPVSTTKTPVSFSVTIFAVFFTAGLMGLLNRRK